MKNSRSIVKGRREKIISMINKTGDIRVFDIAQALKVSEITIRRDLQYLEDKNIIEKILWWSKNNQKRHRKKVDEISIYKEKIAAYAATLVEDGDTIFINTSSTALGMLKYITAKNITVITNNGNAINSQRSSRVTVILTGGELILITH